MRASRALTRAASRDPFLNKMASPDLLIERHAPGVRLSCLKKCEEQDVAKIFCLKCPDQHDCREHFCRNRLILTKNGACRLTLSHVETKIYTPLWGVLPSAKRPEGRAARGRPGNVW